VASPTLVGYPEVQHGHYDELVAPVGPPEVVREVVEVEVAVLRPGAAGWQAGETVKSLRRTADDRQPQPCPQR
jgi:hypothetical protein